MKKLILYSICILVCEVIWLQPSFCQVILQKAVISNGGVIASNGSSSGAFVVGQTAAGTASNSQMTGHFGFFAAAKATNSVAGQGAGSITSLQLVPNPASTELSIKVTLLNAGNIDLELYDPSGHLITTIFSGRKDAGDFTRRFNVSSLPSGAYFVAARVAGAVLQTKLTVVK